MRTFVLGLALGFAAVLLVLVPSGFALTIAADANGWGSFAVGLGPLHMLEYTRTGATTSTLFGPGLLVAAVVVGLLNGVAARYIEVRTRRSRDLK